MTEELTALCRELFPPKEAGPEATGSNGNGHHTAQAAHALSDAEIIERAHRAANGEKFARLWNGDTTGYGSQSEADLALCCLLAFWVGRDGARIDALFRQSGLYREDKWERQDYRERTINEAIARCHDVCEPRKNGHRPASSAGPEAGNHDEGGDQFTAGSSASPNETNGTNDTEATEKHTQPGPSVDSIALAITAQYHFARDVGGRLHVYSNGVYRPHGERVVQRQVKDLLITWGLAPKWSTHRATEVVEYIRVDAPELLSTPPANVLNVQNGLLDVETRELKPHTPKFLSAVQLPMTYDPGARCPGWDQFIAEIFPGDSEALAWEIPAWLMTPDTNAQKAILLLGDGSNGKSTYLRACQAFIGRQNTTALSLHKLEQDRFAVARLVGKLANICPDLPSDHLVSTSTFKALTGGDVVSAERKFCESFEFVPFCRLVFSANRPPHSDDATHGFFRRWLAIPFDRCFEEGAAGTKKPEDLDAQLADPAELSGVLNKALYALAKIRRSSFTQSESTQRAWQEFRMVTDPLAVWLGQNTVLRPTAMVAKADLCAAFNKSLTDSGRPPMTQTAFGLTLKRIITGMVEAQRTLKGRLQWVYIGIGFKSEAEND